MTHYVLSPAYGRDYKSGKAAKEDFNDGKDFIIENITSPWCGKPMSVRDCEEGDVIELRFKQLTGLAIINI